MKRLFVVAAATARAARARERRIGAWRRLAAGCLPGTDRWGLGFDGGARDLSGHEKFQRFISQPDGTVIQQITGTERTRFTTAAGVSVTVNVSGPARNILYPNRDVEIHSMGRYANGLSVEQAAQLGTPQIFISSGLIDFITHADGSITPVTVPHDVTDICAALARHLTIVERRTRWREDLGPEWINVPIARPRYTAAAKVSRLMRQ